MAAFVRRKPLAEHMVLPKTILQYKQGASDKEYRLEIKPDSGLYTVHFAYGRRGSMLTTGVKAERVSITEATSVFLKKRQEQIRKGYVEVACSNPKLDGTA